MKQPGLILTADDYGLNESCNHGIRECIANGIISSVHVMVNLTSDNDLKLLKEAVRDGGNKCGIGLHLNTMFGPAIIQESARFKHSYGNNNNNPDEWHYRGLNTYDHGPVVRNKSELEKMQKELEKQFEILANNLGGADKIDAISSHYNIHFWDYSFVSIVAQLSKKGQIPLRSPLRWELENEPQTNEYYLKTKPLQKVALGNIKKVIENPTTWKLLTTSISPKRLKKLRRNLELECNAAMPVNNSGHWFGQPSEEAMEWFMQELKRLNEEIDFGGYCSEIYMHPASSVSGDDRDYDYKMWQRVSEYITLIDQGFITKFQSWLNEYDVAHGSYRKLLQGENVIY